MAFSPVSKVRLLVYKSSESAVLNVLQEFGVFEPVFFAKGRENISREGEHSCAKIDFAIRFLSPFAPKKKGFRNAVLGDKIERTEAEVQKVLGKNDWKELVSAVERAEAKRNDLLHEIRIREDEMNRIRDWASCSYPTIRNSRFQSGFYSLSLALVDIFEEDVKAITPVLDVSRLRETKSFVFFHVVAEYGVLEKVKILCMKYKGEEFLFPSDLLPVDRLADLEKQYNELLSEKKKNEKEILDLALRVDDLKVFYDFFSGKENLERVQRFSQETSSVGVYEGWVEKECLNDLKKKVEDLFQGVYLEEISLEKEESSPVALKQKSWLVPFGEVTKMFGTPKSSEIDPTEYLAPFFVVFFGFCLTDAGYGLLLTLSTFFLLKKAPLEKGMRNSIRLFFYAGISTIVMGILFGGWFGLTTDQVPAFFTYLTEDGRRLFLGQIFDPMTELVTKVMPLAFALGGIHLALGTFLSGKIAWDHGNRKTMFFVTIPLLFTLLMGVVSVLFSSQGISIWLLIVSLMVAIWGLGGDAKNPLVRVLLGLIGIINEALGWLSNILSYSRLVALGLATGIIAMAFNIVASTIGGMLPPVLNILVMIIILLFGHTLNIALNVLGAYVHSSRLQFVEFFGKFMEGGGREFFPLQKKDKYRFDSQL